jgi:hypothetical protein
MSIFVSGTCDLCTTATTVLAVGSTDDDIELLICEPCALNDEENDR